MSVYLGLPLLTLIAVLQSAVLSRFHVFGGTPDLMLVAVVCWSLAARGPQGVAWAFAGGLLLDVFSGAPPGSAAAGLVLVVYLAGFTEGRLWGAPALLPLAAVLFGSMVYHLVALGILLLYGRAVDLRLAFSYVTLPATFINVLLTLPVYKLARWLHDLLNPPRVAI
ncbi:MAG: rod shape-determining protein MreD [Chloroflexi bacterium]|nr:rod shape-determining protein MreD [Chloroflexota bacterium]